MHLSKFPDFGWSFRCKYALCLVVSGIIHDYLARDCIEKQKCGQVLDLGSADLHGGSYLNGVKVLILAPPTAGPLI